MKTRYKYCSKCGEAREEREFYLTYETKDRLSKLCKKHTSSYMAKYEGATEWTPQRRAAFHQHMSEMRARRGSAAKKKTYRQLKRQECEEYLNGQTNSETEKRVAEHELRSAEPQSIPNHRQGACA